MGTQPGGQRGHALHGFHDLGQYQRSRQQRLAGEVARECRMVDRHRMGQLHRCVVFCQLREREFAQRARRELAGAFARKGLHLHHAARHEHRLQPLAQRGNDLAGRERGRDHEGHRTHHAVGHFVGQPERAVLDARDAVEVVVQVRERAAPARDMDQVVGAAQQPEAPCVEQFEHVGHGRGLGQEVAAEDEALGPVALPWLGVHADISEGLPDFALRGAAGGDLAGLGAAVDLDQHAAERLLGLGRELRRERRGGGKHQVDRRQLDAREQQRLQVERRGDQCAGAWHRSQRLGHVGWKERPSAVERGAAEHGQQRR